ncbi:gonadotropin subunit beta-1-like [Nelusetta ayraudi]|uniref:gonadotropin subunit beta-1-like n=1 Tax=Nelusetta ayraudi TaxID=303726 RepID=UPI003F716BF7
MQLVVMAAVLALAGAGQGCIFGCRPTNISMFVESCGSTEQVFTTICEGQCYQKDPVYRGYGDLPEQRVCNGDWTIEVTHIKGCPVAVSYPVAKSCTCTTCNSQNSYCGRFHGEVPSCLPS